MQTPILTAIVSTYNAERFMQGCLEDLLQQSIGRELEILVIDSGSPQAEGAICQRFMREHPNIRYVRTEREGLYAAWNRAIGLAKGKYLTSANTDDRHRFDAFQKQIEALEREPECDLAYGDQVVSEIENETYEECLARNPKKYIWPDFSPERLMVSCFVGSQPVWRKKTHEENGLFNPDFKIVGDYDMWMRMAQKRNFIRIKELIGLFLSSPNTLSGANNRLLGDVEALKVKQHYLAQEPWRSHKGMKQMLAKEVFGMGYHYIEHQQNPASAKPFLKAAWALDPFNPRFAKTYLLRGVLQSGARLR